MNYMGPRPPNMGDKDQMNKHGPHPIPHHMHPGMQSKPPQNMPPNKDQMMRMKKQIPPNNQAGPGRKPLTQEKKTKDGAQKSPANKKPKEVQQYKINISQHRFKHQEDEDKDQDIEDQLILDDKPDDEMEDKDKDPEEDQQKEEDNQDKPEEESKQDQEEEDNEEIEDRGEEAHEEYVASDQDPNEVSQEPYNPNENWVLEVSCKNKVKSLKKLILEKVGLFKRAGIILMKEVTDVDPEKLAEMKVETFKGSS